MEAKIYRESPVKLAASLAIDFVLFVVPLFILGPIQVLKFLKNSLTVSEKGILLTKGVLSTTTIEIPFSKINSVTVRRGVLGKLLGYGDILILAGNDMQGVPFAGVDNPEGLKSEIMNKVHLN